MTLLPNHRVIPFDLAPNPFQAPPPKLYSDAVWAERHRRLKEMMKENNLDHVLVCHPINARYFADFNQYTGGYYYRDGIFFLINDQAEVTQLSLLTPYEFEVNDQRYPWLKRHVSVPGGTQLDQPAGFAHVFARTLKEGGAKRVGLDAMTIDGFQMLQEKAPDIEFVGVAKQLNDCTRYLMPEEVVLFEEAARLTTASMSAGVRGLHNGMRETDLAAISAEYAFSQGAEQFGHYVSFSSESAGGDWSPMDYTYRQNRRLYWGDIFIWDVGINARGGWWADAGISVFFGDPGKKIREAYKTYVKICHEVMLEIKPGWKGSQVRNRYNEELEKYGFPTCTYAGHGASICSLTAPYFALTDEKYGPDTIDYEFEEGNVMSIEPLSSIEDSRGRKVNLITEEVVVMEKDGLRKLTRHDYPFLTWDEVKF